MIKKYEYEKCVYRLIYETENSTTFNEPNNELKKCIKCNGYDLKCKYYREMRIKGLVKKIEIK